MFAPASVNASSGKKAASPAPRSTRTSCPADLSLAIASGTSATRRSADPVSLTTATFIGGDLTPGGSCDAAVCPASQVESRSGQPQFPKYGPYRLRTSPRPDGQG